MEGAGLICPQCNRTIDDDAEFCPNCHAFVGDARHEAEKFVFCEGCGARIAAGERVCPKCGRPAPSILSTDAAASDLAAGKTASFPRLTREEIERAGMGREGRVPPIDAADGTANPFDPSLMSSFSRDELAQQSVWDGGRTGDDPYHTRKRPWGKIILTLLLIAAIAGAAAFVYYDPWGVMPGLYQQFREAAADAFPSRQPVAGATGTGSADEPAGSVVDADAPLTDDQVYVRISGVYETIASFPDRYGEIVDDYNSWYAYSDRARREEGSARAYALRDACDAVIEELDGLNAPEDTAYAQDVENLKQLAGWMRTRADIICASWDVSLSYVEGSRPEASAVTEPLRSRSFEDAAAADAFGSNLEAWRPVEKGATA